MHDIIKYKEQPPQVYKEKIYIPKDAPPEAIETRIHYREEIVVTFLDRFFMKLLLFFMFCIFIGMSIMCAYEWWVLSTGAYIP